MSKRLATPNEVRQYDSLIFALKKTNIQLENIKKQYTKKSFGQYLTFKSGKGTSIHYVGEVKNGKANGNGIALLSSGSRYEGNWKDNLWHGKGSFFWPDGDKYVGDYKENKRTGKGTYYWHNGDKYVGEWKNDKRDGEGTFYNNDGKIVIGIWSLDELVEKK